MFYSVLLVVCLGKASTGYECTLSARRNVDPNIYSRSIEACTSDADSSVNEALFDANVRGFAYGRCIDQKEYADAINATRLAIKERGHGYNFKAYKAK